jgi:tetratricopeptide (TPR) repeat protein
VKAIEIAKDIPEPLRSAAYMNIAREQVLRGDVEGAVRTASLITVTQEKLEAQKWLTAEALIDCEGDLVETTERKGIDVAELSEQLAKLSCARAAQGEVPIAQRVIAILADHRARGNVLVAIAEYLVQHGRREEALAATEQAAQEAKAMGDDADPITWIAKAGLCLEIARLYTQCGDAEKVEAAIREYGQCKRHDPLGLVEGMGADLAVVGMYLEMGKIEKARMMAMKNSGGLRPDSMPLFVAYYAARGETAKAENLIKSSGSARIQCELLLAAVDGAFRRREAAVTASVPTENSIGGASTRKTDEK